MIINKNQLYNHDYNTKTRDDRPRYKFYKTSVIEKKKHTVIETLDIIKI